MSRTRTDSAAQLCALLTTLAALSAALLLVLVTAGHALTLQIGGPAAALSPRLDRLSVAMLVLVLGVSALVQGYAARNLAASPGQGRFVAVVCLTSAAAAVMVTASHLLAVTLGWELSSLGMLAIIGLRSDLRAGRDGLRRAVRAVALGDGALLAATAIILRIGGDLPLSHLQRALPRLAHAQIGVAEVSLPAISIIAALLVLAAAARAAQLPQQSWLAAGVTIPTPASALLHAGIVNAGGFLLVRLAPLFAAGSTGPALAFTIGLATALYGGALTLLRPDVKGALAHSTTAQMGFMLVACGLGAYAAAIMHLIGHGLYKASSFLAADGTLWARQRERRAPRSHPLAGRPARLQAVIAGAACAVALSASFASFAAPAVSQPGAALLLVFAWVTASSAATALILHTALGKLRVLALAALCCGAYAGLLAGANAYLDTTIGADHATLPTALAGAALLASFAALSVLVLAPARARSVGRLRAVLYPLLLDLSTPDTRRRKARRRTSIRRAPRQLSAAPAREGVAA